MNDSTDDTQRHALTLLTILIGLVVASVVAFGAMRAMSPPASTVITDTSSTAAEPAMVPLETVYFALDSDILPVEANDVLARVAEAARLSADATVVVIPFFDPQAGGDMAARLAQQRALAVQHALEANGVATHRIAISTSDPARMGDVRAAQSVEISLR